MKSLKGDKNQCPGCSEYFNSTVAFDKHRVGKHKNNGRRCLTPAEMIDKGMALNVRGFWVSEQNRFYTASENTHEQDQTVDSESA